MQFLFTLLPRINKHIAPAQPVPQYNHTLVSSSKGMYAISLQGSKRLYLALLLKMFWRAPTYTAASKGVIPRPASIGVNGVLKSTRPKKATPVTNKTVGVMAAATPHPYFLKM